MGYGTVDYEAWRQGQEGVSFWAFSPHSEQPDKWRRNCLWETARLPWLCS